MDLYEAEGINEVNELNIQEDGLTVILFVGVNGVGKQQVLVNLPISSKRR